VILRLNPSDGLPDRSWPDDNLLGAEETSAADLAVGLTSLGFIKAALRRGARVWCAAALIGLLLGAGLLVKAPPAYEASATLVLTSNPDEDPVSAMETDQAIAQSPAVAALAMKKLGIQENVIDFLKTYTAVIDSDKVLLITARAKSSAGSIDIANAVSTEFLKLRNTEAQDEQAGVLKSLNLQVTQAKQALVTLISQIQALDPKPKPPPHLTPAQHTRLVQLRASRASAEANLTVLEQTVRANQASQEVITDTIAQGSLVLDSAIPAHRSHLRLGLEYGGGGLIAGLALGMGLVAVRALLSDRLRRRDDIARALRAPVKLSVGPVRVSRWRPGQTGLSAARTTNMRRVVNFLASLPSRVGRGPASLAVVSVDNPRLAAVAVLAVAQSALEQGRRVAVADLSEGAPAARLLGVHSPGVGKVSLDGGQVMLIVPDPDDIAPVGPLGPAAKADKNSALGGDQVAAASAQADLLLTLVTLDPALGSDHLRTWADRVVAIVSAGRSSGTRLEGVAELARLGGRPLAAAVLIGADKHDESLGVVPDTDDAPVPPSRNGVEVVKQ
jgi:capsular polysaccharide biosynthesis protein